MRDAIVVRWFDAGCWALLLGSRFVTAGSLAYCEAVRDSAPAEAIAASTAGEEWRPSGAWS